MIKEETQERVMLSMSDTIEHLEGSQGVFSDIFAMESYREGLHIKKLDTDNEMGFVAIGEDIYRKRGYALIYESIYEVTSDHLRVRVSLSYNSDFRLTAPWKETTFSEASEHLNNLAENLKTKMKRELFELSFISA